MRTRSVWQLLLGLALTSLVILLPILALLMLGAGGMDYYEDLPGGYLFRGGDGDAILAPLGKESIGGKVVQYAYDDTFIIARQKPEYREYQTMIADSVRRNNHKYAANSYADIMETSTLADRIIARDPFYQRILSAKENYWIIDHRSRKRYGPFTTSEYQQQRQILRIPASFILE
ncbi:hypothetical protein BWI93_23685 [Siphonobacter sp. BAB-5385]|uniref:DUF3997 domain-containing protein n=1 Tax=Siphonobacter sp. BAB-5385 TaxID=1864822 RepID=UPI000B9E1A0C|nr:DUF3997 domain-containing protein [Siphonobacter sp. BAB-5385]OZI05896.1 hypothetical protein BWI93_23685 [Siphonobacter sp. BAB-5385]